MRDGLATTPISLPTSLECVGIQLSLAKRLKLNVVSVYRPPSSSMTDFLDDLEFCLLKDGSFATHPLCAVGDFNCRSALWWNGQTVTKDGSLLELFTAEHGLCQVVDGPTHNVLSSSPSQLDLMFLNQPTYLKCCTVLPPLTDHCPTVVQLNVHPLRQQLVTVYSWDYAHADWDGLRDALSTLDWSSVTACADVESSVHAWLSLFLPIVQAFVPKRGVHHTGSKPWYSPFLHRFARCRDRLFKRSRGLPDTHRTVRAFHRVRNWYVAELRYAERAYFRRASQLLSDRELSHRPHHWWHQAKSLCGLKCRDSIPALVFNGQVFTAAAEKAEVLNEQFATQCSAPPSPSLPNILPSSFAAFEFQHVTQQEIVDHLANLNCRKASGSDDISPRLLLEFRHSLCVPLCHIFNISLTHGHFPHQWKQAVIQPLFKQKGNRAAPSSYRPIALLPCVSKVFESLVRKQLLQHCLEVNCLPDEQYGFLPQRSTVWQLLSVLQDWVEAIDHGQAVHALFIDVAKAFDRVDHRLLCLKLASIGVGGQQLKWFESFLSGRSISTSVDHTRSTSRSITSGVPQGSVLGPLLFIIYFRDLPDSVAATSCLFADDTLVYDTECSTAPSSCCRLPRDAHSLDSWAAAWNTRFNAEKSAHMTISKKRLSFNSDVSLGGKAVPRVSCFKHLGVHLTSTLSWSPHVTAICRKAAPLAGLLKRLAYRCPPGSSQSFIARLYCTFVRPRLEYASPVWGSSCSRQDALMLERLQNSVARTLYQTFHRQLPRPRSTTALKWLGWPTLAWRRRRAAMIFLWRLINGEGPPQLRKHLPRPASERCTYSLRNAERSLEFPLGNTSLFRHSFLPCALEVYSALPLDTTSCSKLSSFLRLLDKHFSCDKFSFGLSL